MFVRFSALVFFGLTSGCFNLFAQLQDRATDDAIRVTVAVNEDGTHTSYQFDRANRKAIATNTTGAGKLITQTKYDLDDAGRFAAGEIFGADGKLRFKARYKYDANNRLSEETHLNKDDAVINRLVYAYDMVGKQAGYTVYDANGKVIGQTTPKNTSPSPRRK